MRTTHYLGGWLLLILITGSNMGWGQSSSGQLNDLAFVLQRASSRTLVEDSLNALATRHGLQVWLTTLDESSPFYSKEVQQQAAHLLQQATPALVITTWHELDPKALQRTEVQVNSTLAERLPLATAEQIIAQALAVYATNPLPEEVLREGMLLALHRLDTYLNALPPVGEVPTITFTNPAATTASPALGLDQLRYSAHQGNYEQLEINEAAYPVPWKALSSGTPTTVLAQVDEETSFPPGVVFRQNENSVPSQPGSESHQQQLTLTGQAHQQEGSLEVYAGGGEDAELVGKLNTISYDALYQKLVLVPLNRDIRRGELLPLVDEVATIYQQAAVSLEVDVSEPLMMADWSWNHALEDGTTGLLANYTREMRQVIRAFRQEQDIEKETAYVFLCYQSKSGNKQGYMPKKRQYGFVFDSIHHNDQELAATIAHELGHGLFHLKHTFETYPTLRKGSTDNLMDYGAGTKLHKYQWDFVHNPKAMLGWFQDDEENADMTLRQDVEWIVEIYSPWYSNLFNEAYKADDRATMNKWINKGLRTPFTKEQVSGLGAINDLIPRNKDGSVPVAILKHYPKAKTKGLYVYYTERKGAAVRAAVKPHVFTEDLPVDLSLHTGEFDAVADEAIPMEEEKVQAYGNLAFDFVWQTMTEQSIIDKATNWFKEAWDYPAVGRDEGTVRYLMEGIAKTNFGVLYKCPTNEKIIYMYDFVLDDKKVPLALYILEDKPSFKRNDLVELDLGNSEDKPYVLLAFCEDRDQSKPKAMVQVANEYAEAVKKYFTKKSDNVLTDGTLLGDPVPRMKITSSGTSGTEGGRFGCTRSSEDEMCEGIKGKKYHGGLDIHAPIGTKIRSIRKGTVFASPKAKGADLGYYIIVRSVLSEEKILYILYAHLKEPSSITGNVGQGDIIGTAGVTGNAKYLQDIKDRQHVHIIVKIGNKGDLYKEAKRINPENFITSKFKEDGSPEN